MHSTADWLILDANFLAYRAYHGIKAKLYHEGIPTTVLYGFLRDVLSLQEQFGTDRLIFCFDSPHSKRKQLFKSYKQSRTSKQNELNKDEKKAKRILRRQIQLLEDKILPAIGYKNIFSQDGYEADDIIAHEVKSLPPGNTATIISSDQDLWQLINAVTQCYNSITKKITDLETFRTQHQISPEFWPHVKALAGCASDDIPGIEGIGTKTACSFFAGTLKRGSKKHNAIKDNLSIFNRNIKLTKLPFDQDIKVNDLLEDSITLSKWKRVIKKLGMDSLNELVPKKLIRQRSNS